MHSFKSLPIKSLPSLKNKRKLYTGKHLKIAGYPISLDEIEHGILRKGKWKYSLGYFNTPFWTKFIKKSQVEKLDYRIHFALNCGAKSCPPIAFYNTDSLEEELQMATQSFLAQETEWIPSANTVFVSKILFGSSQILEDLAVLERY